MKYNLICKKGHYHYSPTPKAWKGMPCGKPLGKDNPLAREKRCDAPMREVRDE